jgi:hypothetical protein
MSVREWLFGKNVDWITVHRLEEDLAAARSALRDTERQLAETLHQLKYSDAQNDRFAEAFGKLMEEYWGGRGP